MNLKKISDAQALRSAIIEGDYGADMRILANTEQNKQRAARAFGVMIMLDRGDYIIQTHDQFGLEEDFKYCNQDELEDRIIQFCQNNITYDKMDRYTIDINGEDYKFTDPAPWKFIGCPGVLEAINGQNQFSSIDFSEDDLI